MGNCANNKATKNSPCDELIGWGGRIRTSEMAGPKPAALPLGDAPIFFCISILFCTKQIVNNFYLIICYRSSRRYRTYLIRFQQSA